jgi:heme-degrading monooxygenase HmoA
MRSRWLFGGREVVAISFWDQQENAQAYNSTGYPEALKMLGKLLEGTPHVRTFDVVSSTLQKVVAA